MDFIQDLKSVFGKWFAGEQLTRVETEFVTYCILFGVVLIILFVVMLLAAYESRLWLRIQWVAEDLWYFIKSHIKTNNER